MDPWPSGRMIWKPSTICSCPRASAWHALQMAPIGGVIGCSHTGQLGDAAMDGGDGTGRLTGAGAGAGVGGGGRVSARGSDSPETKLTRRVVWPALIWSPSLRSLVSTRWPLR